jgi:class 3 adenylate cyclase
VRRSRGLELRIRIGLNAGEVVVRTIGNDLHMDYSAVVATTHLAAFGVRDSNTPQRAAG